jgi:HAMP domain-containing protein
VTPNDQGWFSSRFARLSTARKMFVILTLALLPLGLIAVLASIQTAIDNRDQRHDDVHTILQLKAQRIEGALSRTALIIGAVRPALTGSAAGAAICQRELLQLQPARFALYGSGTEPVCASPGLAPQPIARPASGDMAVEISPDGRALRIGLFEPDGSLSAYGELGRETLASFSDLPGPDQDQDLVLSSNGRRMVLMSGYRDAAFSRSLQLAVPVAGGQLQLSIRTGATAVTAATVAMVLLPILMWIAAALIGWWVLDRFLIRPLASMERAVSAYQPGDSALALPTLSTPAHEIGSLGAAFDRVTRTIASHEAELEAAVERQKRLVREVHHRVKNNLQVVASLLNLHARGVSNEEVAAAYASIQRRVDALAVVHRNHYAELEDNRGVALKPLISELGANLRATAPASAAQMQIRVHIEPYYVTQDVAVSVAFMITELVEFAMFCGASAVTVSLEGCGPTTALLSIESDSLKGEIHCDEKLFDRFDRIVTGLSRQLRSTIRRDSEAGRYALDIAVIDKGDR